MDHKYFMGIALKEAEKALSRNEFPVGCIITQDDRVLVTGSRSGTSGFAPNEIDHAEINALKQLAQLNDESINKDKLSIYSTLEPCLMCFGAIILSGIPKIVYAYEDVMGGATGLNLKLLNPLYQNIDITIIKGIKRENSLNLFKIFFNSPENMYWQNSFLSQYTREQ